MDHSWYLNHADEGARHNLRYTDPSDDDVGQSQGFEQTIATKDIPAGEELVLEYDKCTYYRALKRGVEFINELVSELNTAKKSPTSEIEDENKRNIIDHLNGLSVELRRSEIEGVGVFVTESGASLLKDGMNPFESPKGAPALEVEEFTEDEVTKIFGCNYSVMLMIERMIDPHWDEDEGTWIYALPFCGPAGIDMSFLFNTVDRTRLDAGIEPEIVKACSKRLSNMVTTKPSFKAGEEILGNYRLIEDNEDEEDEDDEEWANGDMVSLFDYTIFYLVATEHLTLISNIIICTTVFGCKQ